MIIAVLRGGEVTGSQAHISGSSYPSCTQADCFDLDVDPTIQAAGRNSGFLYIHLLSRIYKRRIWVRNLVSEDIGRRESPVYEPGQHQSPAGARDKSWVWTEVEKGDGVLDLSPIPDSHNVRLLWFNASVIFYVLKDCISQVNMMFSLLSRNPMPTFQVSQVITYIVHPCNEEYDESVGIIWPCAVTVCLAAIAGVEMFPLTVGVWSAEKI